MPTNARVTDPNALPLRELYQYLAATGLVRRLLELARDEDLGPVESPWKGQGRVAAAEVFAGDITTAVCTAPHQKGRASLVARAGGVIAGLAAMNDLLAVFAPGSLFTGAVNDGESVPAGTVLGTLAGPLDEVLELERTLLNLVSRLSGVATRTHSFVQAVGGGTQARVYDTRKTTPGLRVLEKYAVRCGGGCCHRLGLYDAVLIKDNHLAGVRVSELAVFVAGAASKARQLSTHPLSFVEVEADTLEQFDALLTLPRGTIDIVLLDNMGMEDLARASAQRDRLAPWLELEASGGVTLESVGGIARTGVNRISVGALTHSVSSLDLALDVVVR